LSSTQPFIATSAVLLLGIHRVQRSRSKGKAMNKKAEVKKLNLPPSTGAFTPMSGVQRMGSRTVSKAQRLFYCEAMHQDNKISVQLPAARVSAARLGVAGRGPPAIGSAPRRALVRRAAASASRVSARLGSARHGGRVCSAASPHPHPHPFSPQPKHMPFGLWGFGPRSLGEVPVLGLASPEFGVPLNPTAPQRPNQASSGGGS
jgi:hypothetical protein